MSTEVEVLPDGRIRRREAARYIGVTPGTMAVWDSTGRHGSYFKKSTVACRVYYDFERVKQFCESGEKDVA